MQMSMSRTVVLILLMFWELNDPIMAQSHARAGTPIIISHVTIIDATGSPAMPEMSVEILGDRIVAIEATRTFQAPAQALLIDAKGKFLIPGLWDMHVHTGKREVFFPLYLANGITGIRDMGGDVEDSADGLSTRYVNLAIWRKSIERGDLIGPRMIISGYLIDGYPWPGDVSPSGPSEARAIVDALHDMGVDFIKIKSFLPRDSYLAVADEARREHIAFAGHVPDSVPVEEASSAGQKSIEHLTGVALGCSLEEASLIKKLGDAFAARDRARYSQVQVQALSTFDERKAATLFNLFVHNGTWQVPTLVELRRRSMGIPRSETSDPKWEYVPRGLRSAWEKAASEEADHSMREAFPSALSLTRQMHTAGVGFMAGTDSPNPSIVPGFSLHEELKLLVAAGFTPMEALQTATRNPTRYLQRESDLGTIEVGKLADMVLLSANPLDDISNTRAISAVIVDGRYLDRATLDSMLQSAKQSAK